jgi:tRNA(Ile)-lysidine synthase
VKKRFFNNIFVLKRIVRDIFKKGLFFNGNKILIAMSGGQDSITCFFLIFLIKNQFQLEMGSSNCNHLFQSDSFYSSLNNLNQVYPLDGKYSLSVCPYWLSTEKEARDWRHFVLQRTACFHEFSSLYFGHTQTDRLETLLFQLVRGSGIEGVHSIQWKRKRKIFLSKKIETSFFFTKISFFQERKALLGNIFQYKSIYEKRKKFTNLNLNSDPFSYYRPLLGITRLETCLICTGWSLPCYSDNSNHSLFYTRNKVRKQVLPILRRILNPRLEKTVCRFADILSEENYYLNNILEKFTSEKKFTSVSTFSGKNSRAFSAKLDGELFKQSWKGGASIPSKMESMQSMEKEMHRLFRKTERGRRVPVRESLEKLGETKRKKGGEMEIRYSFLIKTFFNTKRFLSKKVGIRPYLLETDSNLLKSNPRKNWILSQKIKKRQGAEEWNSFDPVFLQKQKLKKIVKTEKNTSSFSNFILLDSLIFAPRALKRRFLKKLLENFQMKEVTFQRVEMFLNALFNKSKKRKMCPNYLLTKWSPNWLVRFSVFFLLLLLVEKSRKGNNKFSPSKDQFFLKPKRKKRSLGFSILFIPGIGVLFFKRKKKNLI